MCITYVNGKRKITDIDFNKIPFEYTCNHQFTYTEQEI